MHAEFVDALEEPSAKIAATNFDLDQAVEKKQFRGDLLARVNEITMGLPPLRDRREDILTLARESLVSIGRLAAFMSATSCGLTTIDSWRRDPNSIWNWPSGMTANSSCDRPSTEPRLALTPTTRK